MCWIVRIFLFHTLRRFQWSVNLNQSSVKITSGLDRTNDDLLTQIDVSAALDPIFKENLANDPFIRYVVTYVY